MSQDFRSPQGSPRPRSLEMYPSVGRPGAGGPRLSEVIAGAGGGPAASSPEIPMPKLMGGGRGGGSAPYAGSYLPRQPGPLGYVVKKGDTLGGIAKRYGVSIQDMMEANPQIIDPNRIKAGAKLRAPEAERERIFSLSPEALYASDAWQEMEGQAFEKLLASSAGEPYRPQTEEAMNAGAFKSLLNKLTPPRGNAMTRSEGMRPIPPSRVRER